MTYPAPDNGWLGVALGLAKKEAYQTQGEEKKRAQFVMGTILVAMGIATLKRSGAFDGLFPVPEKKR